MQTPAGRLTYASSFASKPAQAHSACFNVISLTCMHLSVPAEEVSVASFARPCWARNNPPTTSRKPSSEIMVSSFAQENPARKIICCHMVSSFKLGPSWLSWECLASFFSSKIPIAFQSHKASEEHNSTSLLVSKQERQNPVWIWGGERKAQPRRNEDVYYSARCTRAWNRASGVRRWVSGCSTDPSAGQNAGEPEKPSTKAGGQMSERAGDV